jgi:hypothetical protein
VYLVQLRTFCFEIEFLPRDLFPVLPWKSQLNPEEHRWV